MWSATFEDKTILNEFDNIGREHSFGEVLKRMNDLKSLSVIMKNNIYSVKMVDGSFSISSNGTVNNFFALDPEVYNSTTLENIRPIYFVRETINFNLNTTTQMGPTKLDFTALGFQASYKGTNIKRYLAIFNSGEFVIKEE